MAVVLLSAPPPPPPVVLLAAFASSLLRYSSIFSAPDLVLCNVRLVNLGTQDEDDGAVAAVLAAPSQVVVGIGPW